MNVTSVQVGEKRALEEQTTNDVKRPKIASDLPSSVVQAWRFSCEKHRQSIEDFYNRRIIQLKKNDPYAQQEFVLFLKAVGEIFSESIYPLRIASIEILANFEKQQRDLIFNNMATIANPERGDVIETAFWVLQAMPYQEKILDIISIIKTIEIKTRHDIIQKILPLLQNDMTNNERFFLFICFATFLDKDFLTGERIVELLLKSPTRVRSMLILNSLRDTLNGEKKLIMTLFCFLAPETWDAIVPLIQQFNGINKDNFCQFLCSLFLSENIRNSSYAHLRKALSSPLNPDIRWKLAEWVILYNNELMLHEEHDIVQTAIFVENICNPTARLQTKNPYRVFQQIQSILETEKPITFDVASEEVRGRKLSWNIQTLREKGIWNGYKLKDLPVGIHSKTIIELFQSLQDRLNLLPQKDQEETLNYIQESCGGKLENLRENLVDKPYINQLLFVQGNPDDLVSSVQFQLFCALRSIFDADKTISAGKKISQQEDMLLKMSASVQNCTTGQRDGIANYYNLLPSKYKYGPQAKESGVEEALNFIDLTVQQTLNMTFANESFLKELLGQNLTQSSHTIEYLKNRYHKQVGLRHQLAFDEHTGVLYDSLFEINPSKVLSLFFAKCTPKIVIQQLVIASENALKDGLFMGIGQILGNINGETEYRKFFTFDDATLVPVRLTDKGAIVLLTAGGYLH